MKLMHRTPCGECPWRKIAPAGWLGGHPPEYYADAVANNEVPACHKQDRGPRSNKTAMCAGALTTMKNQCLSASNTPGGDAARNQIEKSDACFGHVREFYRHHTGGEYVHPLLRKPPA